MLFRILFSCLLFPAILSAQVITGTVINKNTLKPVDECLVILKGTTASALTNKTGFFSLALPVPADHRALVFTMLGYSTIEYDLSNYKNDTFFISPKNILLKEVLVSAERKQILNPGNEAPVLDFDLLNDALVVLFAGPGKNNLLLLDDNGKGIASLKTNKNTATLKRDCLGNLQMTNPDSVWQVFYDYKNLNVLKPSPLPVYKQVLDECVCAGNHYFYFRTTSYRDLQSNYFYFSEKEKGVRHELIEFSDTNKLRLFEKDYDLHYFLTERRNSHYTMYNESLENMKLHLRAYREQLQLDFAYAAWLGKIKTEMIRLDTQIFIANITDSAIYVVDTSNKVRYNSGFSALKNRAVLPEIYIDRSSNETWLLQFSDNRLTFIKFDIYSGKELSKAEIPDIPYLPKKIIIHNGAAYYVQKNLAEEQAYKLIRYVLN